MKRIISFMAVICIISGVLLVPVGAEGDNLALTNCDSSLNWSANSQGSDALETDSNNFTEGSGSVGATAINGKLNQISYIPDNSLDVSAYRYLEFDIYFSDITWYSDCGGVMFELTSSGTCDKESNRYMKKVIRNLFETGTIENKENWWHFVFDLDDPQGQAGGGLDKSKLNYFRFYSVDPVTTTPNYTMRIDDMQFTNNPKGYTPPKDDDTSSSIFTAGKSNAKPYAAIRTDVNKELTEKLSTLLFVSYIVIGVLFVSLISAFVIMIVRNKKSNSSKKENSNE